MKKWMAFGMALICVFLLAACVREPAQESTEAEVPEETTQFITKSVTEEPEERSIDPGFTLPATDGTGDADMVVPAPEGSLDPDFDVLAEPKNDEDGMIVITPEPEESIPSK